MEFSDIESLIELYFEIKGTREHCDENDLYFGDDLFDKMKEKECDFVSQFKDLIKQAIIN